MKGKSKRIVSGFLSALTIISSIMQPVTTYAAEAESRTTRQRTRMDRHLMEIKQIRIMQCIL